MRDCILALCAFSFNSPAVRLCFWFSFPKSLRRHWRKSVDAGLERAASSVDVMGVVALGLKGGALGGKAARSSSGCCGEGGGRSHWDFEFRVYIGVTWIVRCGLSVGWQGDLAWVLGVYSARS
jgi:hypothetical protein